MKKKLKKTEDTLRRELEQYRRQGVGLWLDGRPSDPKSISRAHKIAEDGVYMRDYVQNGEGEVERIQFDLVKNR